MTNRSYRTLAKFATISIIILGIGLRLYQYAMERSLWEDEAHMALNIMNLDYSQLSGKLEHGQSAPILYIYTTKITTSLFGYGESALRLFPFIISCLTLPLFYFLSSFFIKDRLISISIFFLFSVNLSLIYFSSELKPYAIDVSGYLLLTFIALTDRKHIRRHRTALLGLCGCLFILLSNVAFISLICISLYLISNQLKTQKFDRGELAVIISWIIVLGLNYYFNIASDTNYRNNRSELTFAFCPTDILSCDFIVFLKKTIDDTFFKLLLYFSRIRLFTILLLPVILLGVYDTIRNKKIEAAIFLYLPIIIHLGLSALHLYPFYYRFILYLVPAMLIIIGTGIWAAAGMISQIHKSISWIFVLYCIGFMCYPSLAQYPLWFREIKPSLDVIGTGHKEARVYITTPHTLYQYYLQKGYIKNNHYKFLGWNLTPDAFYASLENDTANYFLLRASDTLIDGYGEIITDLKKRDLIINEFTYKTYTVNEVRSLFKNDKNTINCFDKFSEYFNLNGNHVIPVWSGPVSSKAIPLDKGDYELQLLVSGTPVNKIFPHLCIFIGSQKIKSIDGSPHYRLETARIPISKAGNYPIRIEMDNDFESKATNEDRNAFIKSIIIKKVN